jgi:hypothetical protein
MWAGGLAGLLCHPEAALGDRRPYALFIARPFWRLGKVLLELQCTLDNPG